jgi:hypothetical protein
VQIIRNVFAVSIGVMCAVLASSLLMQAPASAEDKKLSRAFYLTTSFHPGHEASTACAPGHHMASLWEIFDPSGLSYSTALGAIHPDAGSGPPAGEFGWVRTGYFSSPVALPGTANCSAWTSAEPSAAGSVAGLSERWDLAATAVSPWYAAAVACNTSARVWCVED